jgi:4-hydroxy-3-methylbut-2-en-1-yl diphosphate synthase
MKRRETLNFKVGHVGIGSQYPVTLQSMTNTDTKDTEKTLKQIRMLATEGIEIIRVALPEKEAVESFKKICLESPLPVVADIHFDYRLALEAIEAGASALRINPGNIGSRDKVEQVIKKASAYQIPIRIGVNSGSIRKDILAKYQRPTAEALVESLVEQVEIFEQLDFRDIVLSLKASNVPMMIAANRLVSEKLPYPIHLGVTEAGSPKSGVIKSAVGIGTLLAEGIGDTIRVSLTGDPLNEVEVGKQILKSLHLREDGVEIISCPTCGRTKIDLVALVEAVEDLAKNITKPIKIAVMGCVVNGPGEAREADIGIAGTFGEGLIFRKGEVIRRVKEEELLETFKLELEELLNEER